MKLTSPFSGVPNGEYHPVAYAIGDECPPELLEAAKIMGVVEVPKAKAAK